MLGQVVELIEKNTNFAVTTHVRPDGDGIGSSLGLYWLLLSLGKQAEVIVRDPIPSYYLMLPGADRIRQVDEIDRQYDAVFVIECSDIDRPGIRNLEKQFIVNIDHHVTCERFGDINWIDSTASAVGEMIYNLCKAIGGRITREIAECLYMALITDTGSFHFSNTTDRTLKVASELVKVGVNPSKISEIVYNSYPWSRIELLRRVLNTVKRDPSGRVAWMRQSLQMVEEAGAVDGDHAGFVNIPLSAKEVEAVIYMRETQPQTYRVSFRSKGNIDVSKVAEKFGGGGHKNAAGCRVKGDWDYWEREIVKAVIEAVDRAKSDA
ncbi:MAG: bifunctional oligoribonuclease/PAP phosphatase NrnA [Pyrinomonadaceae bacterium]|nr:bifunctional oligoribonuclease/PAP phosphatase NrnA [Pyrinomonadaceae bacterium]MCX7639219.1 bifunctional oligoribonuclease/PAP phosphatase NrnA [Pyrinomonadaceae bacterium]MDW8303559.1 bifunctional oligoribonuclease/PAP phosphatase NrnA [Acidobacteriota bacterium]